MFLKWDDNHNNNNNNNNSGCTCIDNFDLIAAQYINSGIETCAKAEEANACSQNPVAEACCATCENSSSSSKPYNISVFVFYLWHKFHLWTKLFAFLITVPVWFKSHPLLVTGGDYNQNLPLL